jgi:hypothetical protein
LDNKGRAVLRHARSPRIARNKAHFAAVFGIARDFCCFYIRAKFDNPPSRGH